MNPTPTELSNFRLVKIKYDHSTKEMQIFESNLNDTDIDSVEQACRHAHLKLRKRNNVVDWIWTSIEDLESLIETLERHKIRFRLTDHTTTYYRSPEKLSALREEVDELLSKFVDSDYVLDRIGMVGIENISKYEKAILEKESKI